MLERSREAGSGEMSRESERVVVADVSLHRFSQFV